MAEEAMRQTRSQKRALEREASHGEAEAKRNKLGDSGLMNEVKATIKVELQAGDQPVDMSTFKSDIKEERPSSPDVIVLSDNEPCSPTVNGHLCKIDTDMLLKSSPEEREHVIKQLKEELRLEEAKLVLLKKLRHSQSQKETVTAKPAGASGSVSTPPPLVRGSITTGKGSVQVISSRSSGTVIPPPLVRGGQLVSSKLGSSSSQVVMPPLVRGAQVHGMRQTQHVSSGPPPLLLAPRATVPNVQVQGQRIIQPGLIRVANVASGGVLVNIPQNSSSMKGSSVSQTSVGTTVSESPASRQAAAKLALRKQLEKTLLEIPPPKPPTPDLNFLPSAANNEFIYLVGLEEVVQNLLDTTGKGKGQRVCGSPKEPYMCTQCKTDFTCRWRQEKSGSIMCEQCMTSNQKKVLKVEHTSRLKAAFVKALQQEQEIEQHILQQASSPSSSKTKLDTQALVKQSPNSSSHSQTARQQHSTGKQMAGQLSRSVQPVGMRAVTHTFSSSTQLHNAVTTAALVSRAGKHAGAKVSGTSVSDWRKRSNTSTGVTMAYVNPSLSVHKSSSTVDRQREYLLDMIPSRSISQTANTWK